ncbi:hypothetical protein E4L95_12465 [Paracoccus liaowanqingii]|uniref:Uncharacterized protein n=1 Tax=Paracoccus liaowanqingii TaxID=2560053 RepID=A0A4Z1C8L7_9RHOB|nr:hypothetical protein [Paracoccus liaowanqingii]TGN58390.1 hypothetical protein E4L95_12465 [Paracoccus liaowanqingii]
MIDETSAGRSIRMRVKSALEQVAYQERRLLDADARPYTSQEREEAEALHAEIAELVARAGAFNRMVTDRLSKEAEEDNDKAEQLRRFQNFGHIRVEFAAF